MRVDTRVPHRIKKLNINNFIECKSTYRFEHVLIKWTPVNCNVILYSIHEPLTYIFQLGQNCYYTQMKMKSRFEQKKIMVSELSWT